MSYSPEQIEACILAYRNGDLNYCRAGIIDLLTAYAATLRQQAARVDEEMVERAVAAYRRTTHAMPQTQHDRLLSAAPSAPQGEG